ncbi:hypothetical protein Tco_0710464 [Tanacetum coccineum]
MEEKAADLITPTKISASEEVQKEDISPTTLEAAKTLPQHAHPEGNPSEVLRTIRNLKNLCDISLRCDQKLKLSRRERATTKTTYGKAVLTLVKRVKILEKALKRKTQKVVISESEGEEPEDQGRLKHDNDDEPLLQCKLKSTDKASRDRRRQEVSTGSTKVDSGTASKRGQREGKAPMVEEDIQATHKTKEQIRQEEAGLEEAIKLQAQMDEEVAKQIHLDEMVAKRMAEEEALSEQQKKRKAQVQFEAQYYTEEDWDAIRAKLEANAELTKDVLGKDLPEQDFAKRMVDMVNQRKKHFAEERAKAKRNKPMTQSQLRIYMSNYLKNQGTWKLSQLKKLSFEEIKEEFDKLVQQIDTFVPMDFEATKAKLKIFGEDLQTKTSKKQKIDDKDVPIIGEKVAEVKEEEPVKRTGKRKKQKAKKGINVDKNAQGDSETDKEESVKAMNPTPLATKSNIMSNLRTMFDPPLNEDGIWSLPLQQKMINWRYYPICAIHCLTLEASTIYMLADRKYPLSKYACQVMLKMKLLDGTMDEVCYKLLKIFKKQAGIRK